jgi:aminoglycoside phosphotransferase family enzyme
MSVPGLEEKVAFLSRPENYPVPTGRVETKETHMSWLFLTDTEVWKLKKPVRYEYLDFSTVKARERNCAAEVQLNRRLAPDVYLGAVPLTIDAQGHLQLAGGGAAVDWLVRMRRLPAGLMLDRAIADHTVNDMAVRRVGELLARFYRRSPAVPMTAPEYRKRLATDLRACQQELSRSEYALPAKLLESVTKAQLRFLEQKAELFDERAQAGKIIEAHGDLRPEHICLENPPVIIDCLEFNRGFRILDPVSELAFLALECERLNAARTGLLILETYCAETGDTPPEPLIVFYRNWYACLRAKIAVWHLRDHEISDRAKWIDKAAHYLRLATGIASGV